ncbi:MAG TPA: coatomer subunit epsilon [Acidobacteriaceae bacterium]|nr:coatomer subunit epsilon [Acidobacteriaceae bacterium]
MDTQTRHALKQDKFVNATTSGLEWVGDHRANVIKFSIAVVLVIGVIVAGAVVYQQRSAAANQLFGQAMDVYQTPLANPSQPAEPGQKTYATAADRAQAAYPLFQQTANQYGWLRAGEMARYFAGLTELDLGKTDQAKADLEKATHSGGSNLESLAKLALANLDEQTGQTSQAVTLFQDLIQHPTTTVPKVQAQFQLAALYETSNPQEARRLYAEIKDQNKDTDSAQIATQKLTALK